MALARLLRCVLRRGRLWLYPVLGARRLVREPTLLALRGLLRGALRAVGPYFLLWSEILRRTLRLLRRSACSTLRLLRTGMSSRTLLSRRLPLGARGMGRCLVRWLA